MSVSFVALAGVLSFALPAGAVVSLGKGAGGLLGGDLTDPEDKVQPSDQNIGMDLSEEALMPKNATWVKMTCWPANPPGMIPHQRHPYQSWQGTPACAIFLNKPVDLKWYVGFKDGGYGGPTMKAPYFAAIQLKEAYFLTHFTVTPSGDMPARDPREWAIQGSNTGRDWKTLYACNARDRRGTAFQETSRCETFLYTSFTSETMAQAVSETEAKKIRDKLIGLEITRADFNRPGTAYTCFRIVIASCFNKNSTAVADFNHPPGFALGQLELFGVPEPKATPASKPAPKPASRPAPKPTSRPAGASAAAPAAGGETAKPIQTASTIQEVHP
ncbi:MAG: hypothetical protein NTV86_05335 [Planctomycetota bacterium]|nr:hypothetical protein [Planctomycetota bacterium]